MRSSSSTGKLITLATPSAPYAKLSATEKARFAANRPYEALVYETLLKTGNSIDQYYVHMLVVLNDIAYTADLEASGREATMKRTDSQAYGSAALVVSQVAVDTWRIARPPAVFEVAVGDHVVLVETSTAIAATYDIDTEVSKGDPACFAATVTPSETISCAARLPKVYTLAHTYAFYVVAVEKDGDNNGDGVENAVIIQFVAGEGKLFPDTVAARVVPPLRTSSFARFVIPALEAFTASTRSAEKFLCSTFHATQTLCGFTRCSLFGSGGVSGWCCDAGVYWRCILRRVRWRYAGFFHVFGREAHGRHSEAL